MIVLEQAMEVSIGDIVLAAAALWAAYRVGQLSIILPLARMVKEEIEDGTLPANFLDEDSEQSEEVLRFERVDSQYFAYADGSGKFLAQGKDFLSVFQAIKDRCPGQSFRVSRTQAGFSDEEVSSMVQGIFQVFGDKDADNKVRQ
jgi:hypothetical protein